jgi:PAS domain S-box-containing protein
MSSWKNKSSKQNLTQNSRSFVQTILEEDMRKQFFLHISPVFCSLLACMLLIMTSLLFTREIKCAEQIVVKVGAYENFPKIYTDDNGKISGFWPSLLEYIAKKEQWKIEYIGGTWSQGLNRLQNKKIDILPDIAFTEKRNSLYLFSEKPVLMSWSRLYVHKDTIDIQSIRDLSNKKIAALENSVNLVGTGGLKEILDGFNIRSEIVTEGSYAEVFQAVKDGQTDAGITNRNFGNKNEENYSLKKTPIIFQPITIKFAFPRDSETAPLLAERVDYHMAQLIKDEGSVYYQLLEDYFESGIIEKEVEIFPDWLQNLLQILSFLLVLFISIIITTRFQVHRKTKEIQKINAALKLSEEKYRLFVDHSPDIRYRTDMEGRVVYASRTVHKVLGYTVEESIGINVADLYVDPNQRKIFLEIIEQDGYVNNYISEIKRKDGSIRWIATSAQFYRDHDGDILGIDGISRDITEAKETEAAVAKSEEQWHRTFNSFTDIVTLQDTNLRIIKANFAACAALALTCENIVGHFCHELFHDSKEICPHCPVKLTKKNFDPYSHEIYHEKLGKTFLVSASPVLDEKGELEYIVHVAKDITKWKRMEKHLFLSEKMTSIAGLAAGVAHEINTPLSGILQSSQLINMGLDPDSLNNQIIAAKHGLKLSSLQAYLNEQELDFFLDGIKSSAIKASEIINGLLEFSRPHEGNFSTHNLNKLVQDTLKLARSDFELRKKCDIINMTINEDYSTDLPPVFCVASEIEQVILNLIKNGVQAMAEDTDKKKCLNLRTLIAGENIRIEVEDSGPGMTTEVQKQIFNPFFSTKDVGAGTGLGLSVSYNIICEKHHGKILVESDLGKGALFIVELPVSQEKV